MNRSLLLRRRIPPQGLPRLATVIVLHGGNGQLDDLVPLARSISPGLEVIAVEAPRRVHYVESAAYTWYDFQEPSHPEPVTFGDSLYQLEQLVYEISETNREGTAPLYLLGYDQGALLSLSLSMVVPDYLAGVAAICGCLPGIANWPLPDRNLERLPVLLIYDPNDAKLQPELVEAAAAELLKREGEATLRAISGARDLDSRVLTEVTDWLVARMR